MKRFSAFFSVVLVAAVMLTGCDVLNSSDPVEGQMRVLLTDAPADIKEAHVTILRVELIGEDEGVIVLSEQEQAFEQEQSISWSCRMA